MIARTILSPLPRWLLSISQATRSVSQPQTVFRQRIPLPATAFRNSCRITSFHTTASQQAQGPTADALMEELTELYATAKDEFEIATEETEKMTVYAQEDRDAAREALTVLKDGFNKALKRSDPEVAKEITSRVGQRIQELEKAVTAMEESAVEH